MQRETEFAAGAQVLLTGARTATLLQRLPFLPSADAYCAENGGRIFYPDQTLPTAMPLMEDTKWRKSHIAGPIHPSLLMFLPEDEQVTVNCNQRSIAHSAPVSIQGFEDAACLERGLRVIYASVRIVALPNACLQQTVEHVFEMLWCTRLCHVIVSMSLE